MKRNVETIERTVTEEKVTYIAADGTVFASEEECLKYEKTVECVIKKMYKEILVSQTTQEDITDGEGSPEYRVDFIKPTCSEDLETALKYYTFKSYNDDISNVDLTILDIGETVMIGFNYDEDYCWRIGTIDEYVDRIKKACIKELEKVNENEDLKNDFRI